MSYEFGECIYGTLMIMLCRLMTIKKKKKKTKAI